MGMSMVQLLKLRKAISGISIGALSKATNREHDCIEPWELSTVLEDVLKMAKEMDQVRFFIWARSQEERLMKQLMF